MTDEQLAELEALAARETDPLRISRAAIVAIPSLIAEVKRLRAVVADRAACEAICLAESVAAPQSLEHPWDRGYRAGAASCWSKIRALATPQEKDHG